MKNYVNFKKNKCITEKYGILLDTYIIEYVDYIKNLSKNNKLKIYRGIDTKNVETDLDADEYSNAYTIKKEIAMSYGFTIISGFIDLNNIDWKSTINRLMEKICDYWEFGTIESTDETFIDSDIEFEISINSDSNIENKSIEYIN